MSERSTERPRNPHFLRDAGRASLKGMTPHGPAVIVEPGSWPHGLAWCLIPSERPSPCQQRAFRTYYLSLSLSLSLSLTHTHTHTHTHTCTRAGDSPQATCLQPLTVTSTTLKGWDRTPPT